MLKRSFRLRKNSDFQRLYKTGRRFSTPNLALYYLPSNLEYSQVGFVVSKKVSKSAVVRNNLRRRASAIIEQQYHKIYQPFKMIILIRKNYTGLTPEDLNSELSKLVSKVVK